MSDSTTIPDTPAPELTTAMRKDGQRRAPRCTARELERREARCYDLLHKGLRDSEIKRLCSEEWGVTPRAVESYICRARAALREQLSGRDNLRADAYAFLCGVRGDETVRMADRLRAQEQITALLGLAAPSKVAMTDPSGEKEAALSLDAIRNLSDEALEKLAAAYDVLSEPRDAEIDPTKAD